MRWGLCAAPSVLAIADAAGFDYLEPSVTGMLQPERLASEFMPPLTAQFEAARLRPECYNLLLPGDLKIVGPATEIPRQDAYLEAAFQRAKLLGGEIVVFGSGGARRIPEGWPREDAHSQILDFLSRCGAVASAHEMMLAIEPLNTAECNFINSVAEAAALAEALGHPAVGVLSDLYHITHDGQSYEETRQAMPWLRHVHVAGLGRRAPGADDYAYLRGYFAVLKEAGYAGRISIEATWEDLGSQAQAAGQVLRKAWADA